MLEVDTLLVSDIHLGSRHAKPQELINALRNYVFKRLVILGDVVDSPRTKLDQASKLLIKTLNNLADQVEIVVIQGNHDGDMLPKLFDAKAVCLCQEYHWQFGGARYLALHGDQFDASLKQNASFIAAIDAVDWLIGVIDRVQLRHRLARKLSWFWEKVAVDVAFKAIDLAKQRQVDVIFCGHVHLEHETHNGSVRYYNTGSWLGRPPSLVTVCQKGIHRHWH